MRRRPDPALRARGPLPLPLLLSVFLLFLCLACFGAANPAPETAINLDGTPQAAARKAFIPEVGAAYSIGGDLGIQPELAGYLDLPNSWQAGFRARSILEKSRTSYDYLPQVSLELRKLWLGDEGGDPVSNSEYFSLSLGGYLAYSFNGRKTWINPLGALALGKYWMPFENQPYGLDLSLELSRLITGHLLGRSQLVYITTGLRLFYVLP